MPQILHQRVSHFLWQRQLTFTSTQNETNPQLSADAKWLAFQSDREQAGLFG